jgi:DNA-binding NtrC family response regulator
MTSLTVPNERDSPNNESQGGESSLAKSTIAVFTPDRELLIALERAAAVRDLRIAGIPTLAPTPLAPTPALAGLVEGPRLLHRGSPRLIAALRERIGGAPLLALEALPRVDSASCAELGFDRVVRPAVSLAETAHRCVEVAQEVARAAQLGLLGSSEPMETLWREVRLAAEVTSHVLLLGETGTGKGVAARAIHQLSPQHEEAFETLDCSALSPSLIESELFGHERGAFTGAHTQRHGRLERSGEGTLFLDEIGELEPPLQAKLLRALEERRFERIGGHESLRFQARVIAATHRDLEAEVDAGRFRRDLFYRLDVLRVAVPALRDRRDDLPVLVDHLLRRAARRLGKPPRYATPAMVRAFAREPWPGNVRELANRLEAMTVRGDDGADTSRQRRSDPTDEDDRNGERTVLARLLRECGGNVARVARRLGRPRTTVRSQITRNGLQHLIPRD